MQLFVRAQTLHSIQLNGSETSQIDSSEGLDETLICLSGVEELGTLDVSSRLLGGKVHDSLARAGKVRGQTPKVDKLENKKKKTGTAKRRIQYSRRFVNVVPTFGKKKGPNANS
ncbi:hypothetical protein IRJ41_003180 [Triplophysa rosa]|uniref:40S ribosomal protein S30 n=1 Tax=Triplophysa rosa TaxID=992332 RepID=A0A9W7WBE1_TRIRA|nr:hypothetical protein IRJ41_003180 [Triplophysa rosa]